jgi:hypothetical protein
MNSSASTSQIRDTTTISPRANVIGLRSRIMAGAALVMGMAATAVGLAATSHADVGAPSPNPGVTVIAPAPGAPWMSMTDGFGAYRWLSVPTFGTFTASAVALAAFVVVSSGRAGHWSTWRCCAMRFSPPWSSLARSRPSRIRRLLSTGLAVTRSARSQMPVPHKAGRRDERCH